MCVCTIKNYNNIGKQSGATLKNKWGLLGKVYFMLQHFCFKHRPPPPPNPTSKKKKEKRMKQSCQEKQRTAQAEGAVVVKAQRPASDWCVRNNERSVPVAWNRASKGTVAGKEVEN